jgi:hypothetical protein
MPRGSAPGERRGGRAKGTPNKVTLEVKALASQHGPQAIQELARLAGLIEGGKGKAENEQAQNFFSERHTRQRLRQAYPGHCWRSEAADRCCHR